MKHNIVRHLKLVFSNPKKVIVKICGILLRGNKKLDELYLKLIFPIYLGEKLNLSNPRTYNEKLQWLKLNDKNPIYTKLVDKYEVRKYIADTIGEEYLIPLIGVWDKFEDIDFNKLPNQFVLKCTHDSGGVVICKDKTKFNFQAAKKKINSSLRRNFFYSGREWPYKNIKPKIICEKYLVDNDGVDLKDYKFFCFDGNPKFMYVASEREIKTKFDFFDLEFNQLPIKQHYDNSNKKIEKPENFEEMIELSKLLSKGISHVRVDFYNIKGKIYFGELTLYHFSGLVKFEPSEYDLILGEFIDLGKFGY